MAAEKENIQKGLREILGFVLIAVCILLLLSQISYEPGDIGIIQSPPNRPPDNFIGPVGAWIGFVVFMLFGVVGYLLPVAVGIQGLFLMLKRESGAWIKSLWMLMLALALVCLVELQAGVWSPLALRLNVGNPGGLLGYIFGRMLFIRYLGGVGTGILAFVMLLVALVFLFDIEPLATCRRVWTWCAARCRAMKERRTAALDRPDQIAVEAQRIERKRARLEQMMQKKKKKKEDEPVFT
ncbi:MAG: hypothetical protein EOM20_18210, partial [Spartobacteria bacterium]|nr:hypothetical protein [Spartobacteria bacterium]